MLDYLLIDTLWGALARVQVGIHLTLLSLCLVVFVLIRDRVFLYFFAAAICFMGTVYWGPQNPALPEAEFVQTFSFTIHYITGTFAVVFATLLIRDLFDLDILPRVLGLGLLASTGAFILGRGLALILKTPLALQISFLPMVSFTFFFILICYYRRPWPPWYKWAIVAIGVGLANVPLRVLWSLGFISDQEFLTYYPPTAMLRLTLANAFLLLAITHRYYLKRRTEIQMASSGALTSELLHDLATPITVLQHESDTLYRLAGQSPLSRQKVEHHVKLVRQHTELITQMISTYPTEETLEFKRAYKPAELRSVLSAVELLLEFRLKRFGIHLQLSGVPSEPVCVFIPERDLKRVLLNLISNSIEAIESLPEKWIRCEVIRERAWLKILVVDSGRGIPQPIQFQMMNPFFSTKEGKKNSGLGLAISKRIAEFYGGELKYLPTADRTTFQLSLRLCPRAEACKTPPQT